MPPKRPRIVPVAPAPAPAPATVAVPARAKRTPRRAATPPPVVAPKAKRTRRAADPPAPVPVPADPIVPALAPAPALVAAAPPAANVPTPALTALDLAISFDTTGSMGPCLYQVRKELAALTQELFTNMAAMGVQVRVAVIAQADYDASPFVTKHMDFSDRAIDVATFITGVTASSGCWNEGEAYEQALRLGNNLTWRPDATKAFVIVGDDLPHAPDFHGNDLHVDWRQEARELATKDVALYSVRTCTTSCCNVVSTGSVAQWKSTRQAFLRGWPFDSARYHFAIFLALPLLLCLCRSSAHASTFHAPSISTRRWRQFIPRAHTCY